MGVRIRGEWWSFTDIGRWYASRALLITEIGAKAGREYLEDKILGNK